MDQAAGSDAEHRDDAGPPALRKAPADDVQRILSRYEVQRDRGDEKREEMLCPEQGPPGEVFSKKSDHNGSVLV